MLPATVKEEVVTPCVLLDTLNEMIAALIVGLAIAVK